MSTAQDAWDDPGGGGGQGEGGAGGKAVHDAV